MQMLHWGATLEDCIRCVPRSHAHHLTLCAPPSVCSAASLPPNLAELSIIMLPRGPRACRSLTNLLSMDPGSELQILLEKVGGKQSEAPG